MSSCGKYKHPHDPEEAQDISPPHAFSSQQSKCHSVKHVNPLAEPKGCEEVLCFTEEEGGGGLCLRYN